MNESRSSPLLSIVIPAYNEEKRISFLREDLFLFCQKWKENFSQPLEIIPVNDASKDNTLSLLESLKKELQENHPFVHVQVVSLAQNGKKGGALCAGVEKTSGEWVLTMDADVATSSLEFFNWIEKGFFSPDQKDTIFLACREHEQSKITDPSQRRLLGQVYNFCFQFFFGIYIKDSQCGFKLYPGEEARRLFSSLQTKGWAHDVELVAKAHEHGYSFQERPIDWKAVEGSKVRVFRDGIAMATSLLSIKMVLWKYNLRRTFQTPCWDRMAVGLFFILYLFLIFFTFQDYGITWDERVDHPYGERVLDYYLSGFQNKLALTYEDKWLYGSFGDFTCALASKVLPWETYTVRHLVCALFGLLGIYYIYLFSLYFSHSRWLSLLSSLLLFFTPSYFGHSFNNLKDLPFAVFYLISLYYVCISMEYWKEGIPKGLIAKIGISSGLLLGIRIGGLLLFFYFALFYMGFQLYLARRKKNSLSLLGKKIFRNFFLPLLLAYGIMLFFWPRAQHESFIFPLWVLQHVSQTPFRHVYVMFEGHSLLNTHLPWYYLPKWILISTPLPLLAGTCIFAGFALLRWKKRKASMNLVYSFLFFAFLFPLTYTAWKRPPVYNGMRHFLFLIPLLPLFSSLALHEIFLLGKEKKISSLKTSALGILVLLIVAYPVGFWYIQSHPYQNLYFNESVGGLPGAFGKYDLDYWGASCKEAALWLNHRLEKEPLGSKIKIALRENPEMVFQHFLDSRRFELVDKEDASWEYLISTTNNFYREGLWLHHGEKVEKIQEFDRVGVPIVAIYQKVH